MADFDGATYEPERDRERLTRELDRVRGLMEDGEWRTLAAIAEATGAPEASVSARLRDLRKQRHGSRIVERRYVSDGLWEYRLGGRRLVCEACGLEMTIQEQLLGGYVIALCIRHGKKVVHVDD